jgi:hypothetical protein
MLSPPPVSREEPQPREPEARSRVGVASFAVSLLSLIVSGHLMPLLAAGVQLSHGYLVACQWTAAVLAGAGVVLAIAALFDRDKNRFLGMLGWWLGIFALSTLALSIRLAVRRHLMHF